MSEGLTDKDIAAIKETLGVSFSVGNASLLTILEERKFFQLALERVLNELEEAKKENIRLSSLNSR